MLSFIITCKISVLWLDFTQLEVVSLAPCVHITLAVQTGCFDML